MVGVGAIIVAAGVPVDVSPDLTRDREDAPYGDWIVSSRVGGMTRRLPCRGTYGRLFLDKWYKHLMSNMRSAVALMGVALVLLLTGCEEVAKDERQAVMPKLIGVSLDKAKSQLEDRGFNDIETDDAAEDRAIFVESNWNVVSQNIPPGRSVPTAAKIKLGAAKPDDAAYATLLAASGDRGALDRKRADDRAQADSKHNACNLLKGLRINSTVFDDQLQAPKSSIDDYEDGFRSVETACANEDTSVTVTARTWPSAAEAINEANHNVRIERTNSEAYKLLVGEDGVEVTYPEGGGYVINPTTGICRQSFVVGTWQVFSELLFLDRGVSSIHHQPDPVPSVISLLDQIKAQASQLVASGKW